MRPLWVVSRCSYRACDLVPRLALQLERRGYRVDSRHRVIPVSLPDGRRAMLPVDQLQVSYVGQRAY